MVDDNLVETDKIGAGAFFWALPSKGFQSRQNLIDNLQKHTEEIKKQIEETRVKIDTEKGLRVPLDGERDEMLQELAELQKENSTLSTKMKMYEKCDPKRMEELAQKKKVCQ